jgi:hypothetical protein
MAQVLQKIYELAVGSFSEDEDSSGKSSVYTSDSSEDTRAAARRKRQVAAANAKMQRERPKQQREKDHQSSSISRGASGSGGHAGREPSSSGNRRSASSSRGTTSSSGGKGTSSSGGKGVSRDRNVGGNSRDRRSQTTTRSNSSSERKGSSRDPHHGSERQNSKSSNHNSRHHPPSKSSSSRSNNQNPKGSHAHRRTVSQHRKQPSQEAVMDAMLDKLGSAEVPLSDDEENVPKHSPPAPSSLTSGHPSKNHLIARPYNGRGDDRYAPIGNASLPAEAAANANTNAGRAGGGYRRNGWDSEPVMPMGQSSTEPKFSPPHSSKVPPLSEKTDSYLGPVGGLPSLAKIQFSSGQSVTGESTQSLSQRDSFPLSDRYTSFRRGDASVADDSVVDPVESHTPFSRTHPGPVGQHAHGQQQQQQQHNLNHSHQRQYRVNNGPTPPNHMTQFVPPTTLNQSPQNQQFQAPARKRLGSRSLVELDDQLPQPTKITSMPGAQAHVAHQVSPTFQEQAIAAPVIDYDKDDNWDNWALQDSTKLEMAHVQPQPASFRSSSRTHHAGVGTSAASTAPPQQQRLFITKPTHIHQMHQQANPNALDTSLSYSQSEQEGSSSINSSSHMSYSHTSNSDCVGVGDDDGVGGAMTGAADSRLIALEHSDQPNSHAEVMHLLLNPNRSMRNKRPNHTQNIHAAIPKGIYRKSSSVKEHLAPPNSNSNNAKHFNPIVQKASSSDASEASSLTEEDELNLRRGRFLAGSAPSSDPHRSAPSPVMEEEAVVPVSVPVPSDDVTNSTPSDVSHGDINSRSSASPCRDTPKLLAPRLGSQSLAARSHIESTLLVPLSKRASGADISHLQGHHIADQPLAEKDIVAEKEMDEEDPELPEEEDASLAASFLEFEGEEAETIETMEGSEIFDEPDFSPDTKEDTSQNLSPINISSTRPPPLDQSPTMGRMAAARKLIARRKNRPAINPKEEATEQSVDTPTNIDAPAKGDDKQVASPRQREASSQDGLGSIIARRKSGAIAVQTIFRGFLCREDLTWEVRVYSCFARLFVFKIVSLVYLTIGIYLRYFIF